MPVAWGSLDTPMLPFASFWASDRHPGVSWNPPKLPACRQHGSDTVIFIIEEHYVLLNGIVAKKLSGHSPEGLHAGENHLSQCRMSCV
jgi:hypothetical protein